MKKTFLVRAYILGSIFPLILNAQVNITNQNLTWYCYFFTLQLNDKWHWQSEVQERTFISPFAQHQFLFRTHIHRELGVSNWEVSAGGCLFLHNPNDPNASNILTVPELRPHIEFGYKQKLDKITIEHRYRTELRFFHNTNVVSTELEDGFNYRNMRLRYGLQAMFPFWKIDDVKKMSLKVSNEIHINMFNSYLNIFEQNRIYAGLNVSLSSKINVDIGYLNWFQQRSLNSFYNRHIIRLAVFHKIGIKKTE